MSVKIEIHYEGLEELQTKLQTLDSAIKRRIQNSLNTLAQSIKETAQQLAPVRTGYLRSTIFAKTENWLIKVGARAPYAAYVEFGTRFMRGRRFLSQALQVHIPQLRQLMDLAVEEAKREAGGL